MPFWRSSKVELHVGDILGGAVTRMEPAAVEPSLSIWEVSSETTLSTTKFDACASDEGVVIEVSDSRTHLSESTS